MVDWSSRATGFWGGHMSTGSTGGSSGGDTQRGRAIYKLGTHKLRVKNEQNQVQYVDVPILSRALRRVGNKLQLTQASQQDIETVVEYEGGNAIFYKRGSSSADRILIIYEQAGSGGEIKVRQIQIPVPRWAPNYKLVSVLAAAARQAGLQLRGIRRHGFLIQPPSGSTGGGTGGGGTGG